MGVRTVQASAGNPEIAIAVGPVKREMSCVADADDAADCSEPLGETLVKRELSLRGRIPRGWQAARPHFDQMAGFVAHWARRDGNETANEQTATDDHHEGAGDLRDNQSITNAVAPA